MAETKRPGVMGTGEEETFVRKPQYSLYSLLKMKISNIYLMIPRGVALSSLLNQGR
jgi:hypothetical protein